MEYTQENRDRAAWLNAHGIDPAHVPADSTFEEDTGDDGSTSVTFQELTLDPFGRAHVDKDTLRFRTESRTVAGVRPFAEWLAERDATAEAERAAAAALAELDPEEAGELRGQALDDALSAAGLPKSGTADEKRARLAEAAAAAHGSTLGDLAASADTLGDLDSGATLGGGSGS